MHHVAIIVYPWIQSHLDEPLDVLSWAARARLSERTFHGSRSRVQVRLIPKDETITTEILDIFRFQDSMIAEVVEFTDTALVKIQ